MGHYPLCQSSAQSVPICWAFLVGVSLCATSQQGTSLERHRHPSGIGVTLAGNRAAVINNDYLTAEPAWRSFIYLLICFSSLNWGNNYQLRVRCSIGMVFSH